MTKDFWLSNQVIARLKENRVVSLPPAVWAPMENMKLEHVLGEAAGVTDVKLSFFQNTFKKVQIAMNFMFKLYILLL